MKALARRCTAINRHGLPCGRAPIPGGFVCVMHGGAAPAVQASARDRLLLGADRAIDYLLNMLIPRPPCEHCGRSDAERDPTVVRACQLVLDRSGFHPTMTVEQVAPPSDIEGLTDDEMITKLERMLASARAIRARKQRLLGEGPVDAIVVDEGYLVPEDDEVAPPPDAPAPQADEPIPDETGTPDKRTDE